MSYIEDIDERLNELYSEKEIESSATDCDKEYLEYLDSEIMRLELERDESYDGFLEDEFEDDEYEDEFEDYEYFF